MWYYINMNWERTRKLSKWSKLKDNSAIIIINTIAMLIFFPRFNYIPSTIVYFLWSAYTFLLFLQTKAKLVFLKLFGFNFS